MRHATILVAVLTITPLTNATAQVRPGAQVRVAGHFCQPSYSNCVGGSPQQYVGTFVTWEVDTLVIQNNGDTLSVPASLVTRLDVSRGRKANTGKGAGIGVLLGVVAGALIGYASYESESFFIELDPEAYAVWGAVFGGLVGGGVGALIGASIRTDRWQEVPLDRLRVNLGPQRDGRFGFGASVRL